MRRFIEGMAENERRIFIETLCADEHFGLFDVTEMDMMMMDQYEDYKKKHSHFSEGELGKIA